MYQEYFKLTHKPFSLTPDPAFLFLSTTHREALGHMLFGLNNRTGFIAVIGEVGTGKTTLLRSLLAQLPDQEYRTAFIFNPRVSSLELLRGIMREFGLEEHRGGRDEMLNALNHYLLAQNEAGRTVVLVIDEAQNLGAAALEEVRLLSNLETETDKLLQIVLVGQPELAKTLEDRKLRQLRQRISIFYHLLPLTPQECLAYARHRIEVAGGDPDHLFQRSTLLKACRVCKGIPRKLNVLLDRALLTAYTSESRHVNAGHLKQAVQDLRTPMRAPRRALLPWLVAAPLMLALVFAGYYLQPDTAVKTAAVARVDVETAPAQLHPLVLHLSNATSLASRNLGLAALLQLWNREPLALNTAAPLEQIVRSRTLSLYRYQGSVDGLLALNTPALLPIRLPGVRGQRFFALTAAQGNRYRVAPALAGEASLGFDDLESFWSGEAWILWANPAGVSDIKQLGDQGKGVAEIQMRLLGAGFFAGVFDGNFDHDTLVAVKAFQHQAGLPVDGRVGPQTLIRLYQVGGIDAPVLLDSGKARI